LSKLQARRWLSHALYEPGHHTAKSLSIYAKYSPILIFLTGKLSYKRFLIWLLTIPPHLKYATTVSCNLSLVAALACDYLSFSDINVSQGSVATHMRCGGIFTDTAASLLENLIVKKTLKIMKK